MCTKFALLAVVAFAFASAAPASTIVAELHQSYDVVSPYDLHHAISYNRYGDGGAGMTNSYNLDAPGGTMNDGFPKSASNPPLWTYIMATSNLFDVSTDGG